MSIIDKLGINPIEYYFVYGEEHCKTGDVREVEQQRNDLLKISIDMIFDRADWLEYYPEEIKVIEGIAKMPLSKIKELYNE